jgi:hypothetical protein
MPFVQRFVEPKFVTRSVYRRQDGAAINDHELATVTNTTFSNAIKQLASLMLIANEIFTDLTYELGQIQGRSNGLRLRIDKLATIVDEHDPKLVPVRK